MASAPFTSIYLDANGDLSIRKIDKVYAPTGSQSLIAVKYSGVNAGDLRHFYMGFHSFVAGYDWIGTVVEVGPESPYLVGEVLFGLAMWGHQRPLHVGAHQDYLLADPFGTCRVPKDMLLIGPDNEAARDEALAQVVSWPSGTQTAIDMLFNVLDFAFPGVPGVETGADPRGRAILIVSCVYWYPGTS